MAIRDTQVNDLLYQALDTERGGIAMYRAAIACAVDDGLRRTWTADLHKAEHRERVLRALLPLFGLDPEGSFAGRELVQAGNRARVESVQLAHDAHGPAAAQITAAECVDLADTKQQLNWRLLAYVAGAMPGSHGAALRAAVQGLDDQQQGPFSRRDTLFPRAQRVDQPSRHVLVARMDG